MGAGKSYLGAFSSDKASSYPSANQQNQNINQPFLSGWYYDIQKDPEKSPLTTVSLHSNQIYTGKGDTGWDKVDDPEEKGVPYGYSKTPLCTSILTEDFNVQVSNHWSDFGGDPLSELWDRAKPLAPFAEQIGQAIQRIAAIPDNSPHGSVSSYLSQGIRELASNGAVDKISDYLNRKLIVQGTRFSYYGGTDVSFGALSMKFTLFPTWINGTLWTVNKQLGELYPYIIGKFVTEDFNGKIPALKEYIGWQKPPGGYRPLPQDIDKIQKGTLKLKIGAHYSIPNLLVQDSQFTFSKQMVKLPGTATLFGDIFEEGDTEIRELSKDKGTKTQISPLYCDVSILFRPATKFTDVALRKYVIGVGRQQDIDNLTTMMDKKIEQAKQNYKDGKL